MTANRQRRPPRTITRRGVERVRTWILRGSTCRRIVDVPTPSVDSAETNRAPTITRVVRVPDSASFRPGPAPRHAEHHPLVPTTRGRARHRTGKAIVRPGGGPWFFPQQPIPSSNAARTANTSAVVERTAQSWARCAIPSPHWTSRPFLPAAQVLRSDISGSPIPAATPHSISRHPIRHVPAAARISRPLASSPTVAFARRWRTTAQV